MREASASVVFSTYCPLSAQSAEDVPLLPDSTPAEANHLEKRGHVARIDEAIAIRVATPAARIRPVLRGRRRFRIAVEKLLRERGDVARIHAAVAVAVSAQ